MDSSKASLANRQLDWTYCCWSLSFNLLENDWMDVLINSIVVTLYTQPSNLHLAHMRNPTPSSWSAGPPCSSSILLCQCTGIQVKTTPPSHLAWVFAQNLLLAAPHTHFTPLPTPAWRAFSLGLCMAKRAMNILKNAQESDPGCFFCRRKPG